MDHTDQIRGRLESGMPFTRPELNVMQRADSRSAEAAG